MSEPFYVRVHDSGYDPTMLRYVFAVTQSETASYCAVRDDQGRLAQPSMSICEPFRESETSVCPLCQQRLPDAEVPGACRDCQAMCNHRFVDVYGDTSDYCLYCSAVRAANAQAVQR